jgi:hypothetical protein
VGATPCEIASGARRAPTSCYSMLEGPALRLPGHPRSSPTPTRQAGNAGTPVPDTMRKGREASGRDSEDRCQPAPRVLPTGVPCVASRDGCPAQRPSAMRPRFATLAHGRQTASIALGAGWPRPCVLAASRPASGIAVTHPRALTSGSRRAEPTAAHRSAGAQLRGGPRRPSAARDGRRSSSSRCRRGPSSP